jgi:5-methylcytosine-specific restriction protein A
MRGRRLQQARYVLFRAQPLCVLCGLAPATIRDHILALSEGGRDELANTQGVCDGCHQRKTTIESQRGSIRHR